MEAIQAFMAHYHPFFVHFPIALILIGALLQLAWAIKPLEWLKNASTVNLVLGALSSIPAVVSGLAHLEHHQKVSGVLAIHRNLGFVTLGWALIYLIINWVRPAWLKSRVGATIWVAFGAVAVMITGYYGGIMME